MDQFVFEIKKSILGSYHKMMEKKQGTKVAKKENVDSILSW